MREVSYDEFHQIRESGRPFLLDLYVEKCGPCQQLKPMMSELANDLQGVEVFAMDVLKNRKIYHEQGLKTVPTVMFFQSGEERGRLVGLQEKDTYLAMVNQPCLPQAVS